MPSNQALSEELPLPRCGHSLVIYIQNPPGDGLVIEGRDWWASCLLCGVCYNRTEMVLKVIRKQCDKAYRVDYSKMKFTNKDAMDLTL
jgi:hypothetical protein